MSGKNDVRRALLDWTEGSPSSERLASGILALENFEKIDLIHPYGGPDGGKDIICFKDNNKWVCAVYFPKGQREFSDINSKFEKDFEKAKKHAIFGFIFLTNQELKEGEKKQFAKSEMQVEIYDLNRIEVILKKPVAFVWRAEFLGIGLTREEIISYAAYKDGQVQELSDRINSFIEKYSDQTGLKAPLEELKEFKREVRELTGDYGSILSTSYLSSSFLTSSPLVRLNNSIPLNELREFKQILDDIVGDNSSSLFSVASPLLSNHPPISRLYVPLDELKEYAQLLDKVKQRLEEVRYLQTGIKP